MIPGFIGAAVVLGIAYFIGKMIADLVENLLTGVGFDSVPQKLRLNLSDTTETTSPSALAGKLAMVSIVLLSLMQALPMMGLESFAGHMETFTGFATKVLLGLVIVALGMFLANFVAKLVKESGVENADKLAMIAKVAILLFAGGFGLQQMGLSASIVNVAFGSILGGLGLAAAIAFGWGGRDAAKRIVDRAVK
ncbi:MAG: mechanosensitive ion channel [Mariniblastus sp.]